MRSYRFVKWGIVLLLLAALPGMTAVVAQEQEPAPPAPVAIERGESAAAIPWVNTESEPNDTALKADDYCVVSSGCGGVNGGVISSAGDVDFWRLYVPDLEYFDYEYSKYVDRDNFPVLIDIEAESMGSPLNAVMCLYADDGVELACSDDTDTKDPMIYYNFDPARTHYLAVRANQGAGVGPNGKYQLLFSTPYLLSAAAANLGTGNVEGIPFQAGDILAFSRYEGNHHKWVLLFDVSDLAVKGNVTNLSVGWRNSDYLLLGFAANVRLPGIGRVVTPWEVVVFNPAQVGPKTTGSFQLWWNGRQQGLTTTAEKLDAVDWPNWAGDTRLLASTAGAAAVYGGPATTLRLADEDVGMWMNSGDDEFYPRWSRARDMSSEDTRIVDIVAFSSGNWDEYVYEDTVNGIYNNYWERGHYVAQGNGLSQKNVMTYSGGCHYDDEHPDNEYCWGEAEVFWNGPENGWNYNIDAIQVQQTIWGMQ